MSDEQLFEEIEMAERSKRRAIKANPAAIQRAFNAFVVLFQDLIDGFSLPKGVSFKYAR